MVGILIVSHSQKLAESVVEFTKVMASGAKVAAAGGLEDGSFGTSFDKIYQALDSIYSDEGVVILMDMGSAVMTTEMVVEAYGSDRIKMADCPLVEGAVVATLTALGGVSLDEMMESLETVKASHKF